MRYPLENYRPTNRIGWGRTTLLAGPFANQTFPTLLRWAPLVVAPALLRAGLAWAWRHERRRLRILTVLITAATAAAVSITYYPDVIHIAIIAPVFLVAAAELCAAVAMRLATNLERARALYPHVHATAFGPVAFHSRWEPLLVEHVRELLRAADTRELFCYPNAVAPYLTIGAINPTRFQNFLAPLFPAAHTAEVLSVLKARDLPYVIGSPLLMRADDPVVAFINERYEVATVPAIEAIGEQPTLWLYRRKGESPRP